MSRSYLCGLVAVAVLAACGGTPHAPSAPAPSAPAQPDRARPDKKQDLSELETPPRPRLLAIDWNAVRIATDADALALWAKLGLTGADYRDKLEEVPVGLHRSLATALLREGNFTCVPAKPPRDCTPPQFDVPQPADTAGMTDPCLRRMLALWAIGKLQGNDIPLVIDALKAIVAIPSPEAQLTVAALAAIPEADQDRRLEVFAAAYAAGHHEIVNNDLVGFDEAHLAEAVTKHHIDGALEGITATTHRAVFLAAIADAKLATKGRRTAIEELVSADDKLAPDLKAALVKATADADCTVAAAAARALVHKGEAKFAPKRPRATTTAPLMRAMCVLAAYEIMQGNDEASLLPSYLPAAGYERVTVSYDALSDSDPDGDGNPHTEHDAVRVPRSEAVVPEIEAFARALQGCKGTTCKTDDHEFTLVWKPVNGELLLHRIDIVERPPCPK